MKLLYTLLCFLLPFLLTAQSLEQKYARRGPFGTGCFEHISKDRALKKYVVYYPLDLLETEGKKYPALVLCNGTGFPASKYPGVFRHLASWGFIVIGTEESWSGKGNGAEKCMIALIAFNRMKDSLLYNRVDLDHVGIAGHSQGGAGAFNGATRHRHSAYFKTIVSLSGTHQDLAASWLMRCPYDPSLVSVPVFMTSTSNPYGWDENRPGSKDPGICNMDSMRRNREMIRSRHNVPVVIARIADKKRHHGHSLADSLPYTVAWFRYWLMNDAEAGRAFFGSDPELKRNPRWQDVEIVE